MPSWTTAPIRLDDGADPLAACDRYAVAAFTGLLENDLRPWASNCMPVALLVQALYCARRAEAATRASTLQGLCELLVDRVAAERAGDDAALAGLCEEWLGDSYLLLESAAALSHYDAALDHYERADAHDVSTWHLQHSVDHSGAALDQFIAWRGHEQYRDALATNDHEAAVRAKQALCVDLLADRYDTDDV